MLLHRGGVLLCSVIQLSTSAPPFFSPPPLLSTAGGLVNCDGNDAPTVLRAITALLTLDPTCSPVAFMALMPEHAAAGWKTPIKAVYKSICEEAEGRVIECTEIERFAFYEAAKKAYAVVSTGETAFYANVILTKGIIGETGK